MKRASFLLTAISTAAAMVNTGCARQAGGIFYEAGRCPVVERTAPMLAVDGDAASATPQAETTTQPEAASQPVGYTSSRGTIRQLAFLALLGAAAPRPGEANTAREASEAGLASARSLAVGGASSLAAPQPRTLAAVVSQSGLQRGMAVGLGFGRTPNIFSRQANPLSGPDGKCRELINAGFFPDAAACRKYFGK